MQAPSAPSTIPLVPSPRGSRPSLPLAALRRVRHPLEKGPTLRGGPKPRINMDPKKVLVWGWEPQQHWARGDRGSSEGNGHSVSSKSNRAALEAPELMG